MDGHGMWLAYIPHMNLPDSIASTLEYLEKQLSTAVSSRQTLVDQVHELQQPAARNLLQYLCLRSGDIRALQDELHIHGLSSLASSESHILSQLQAIRARWENNIVPINSAPAPMNSASGKWWKKRCGFLVSKKMCPFLISWSPSTNRLPATWST